MPNKTNQYDDFTLDNIKISRHALQRAQERGIPIEDLRRNKPKYGQVIISDNTVITTFKRPGQSGQIVPGRQGTTFTSYVEFKSVDLVGMVIGKQGGNIKGIQSIFSSQIHYNNQLQGFKIEALTWRNVWLMKKFLKCYLEMMKASGKCTQFVEIESAVLQKTNIKVSDYKRLALVSFDDRTFIFGRSQHHLKVV